MISAKFDPKLFFQRSDNVALHVPGEELFGLMRRSLDMPGAWGALVTRASGAREVVRAGDVIAGADAEDVMFVRCTPIELTLQEDHLIAADSISCKADVTLHISVVPDQVDLCSFAKTVLGSRRVVQAKDIARIFQAQVRSSLSESVGAQTSKGMLSPGFATRVATALHEALQAPCFSTGLSLERMPVVHLRSESLTAIEQKRERVARDRAEHEAASDLRRAVEQAQKDHLAHVTEVLQRLSQLATESPEASLGQLIRTFPDSQRGELHGALFAIEPAGPKTRWIVVAAGDELLFFDPVQLERPARTVTIAGPAGRVRSVQFFADADGPATLWLGAQSGVYALPPYEHEIAQSYVVKNAPDVRGGFNSVALANGTVVASHSELGLWRWQEDRAGDATAVLESTTRGAKTVRHVQAFDGSIYCAIDNRIARWESDSNGERAEFYDGSIATITSLLVTRDGVFAGNNDGDVLHWPDGRRDKPERIHMGSQRAVESLFSLETYGVRRLFFAETSPRVQSRVVGDNFVRFYEAGGQTLRRVEVARDIVAATNELRDRVFVWTTGSPGPANSVIPIGSITGRSVQDVCLLM